ncbi:unnamed protein product [Arctogadus glacialis]
MMSSRSIRAAAYRWNLDERKCLTAARLPAAQTSQAISTAINSSLGSCPGGPQEVRSQDQGPLRRLMGSRRERKEFSSAGATLH